MSKKKNPKLCYHIPNDLNKSKSTFPGKWFFDYLRLLNIFPMEQQKKLARAKSNGYHLIDGIFEAGCR